MINIAFEVKITTMCVCVFGLQAQDKSGFIIDRTEGYIGVLVDDLTRQGAPEPYRYNLIIRLLSFDRI